ncbi:MULTISPECIES: DUF6896 domain-containing protein [Streptomyces]|uniref:DUF6896 domain-containing protein n=1 Tax=Streptomyces TaxID=1883 RepID=UPI00117E04D3|nr:MULTISPECIES: hypothetical protein [Streptomyces]
MNDLFIQAIEQAASNFTEAASAIEHTFQLEGASSITAAVNRKKFPRKGRCENGYEYFVHGFGYTVIVPPEGQVHVDGGSEGDYFTIYDMALFLETSGLRTDPSYSEIREGCEYLCSTGRLKKVQDGKYWPVLA